MNTDPKQTVLIEDELEQQMKIVLPLRSPQCSVLTYGLWWLEDDVATVEHQETEEDDDEDAQSKPGLKTQNIRNESVFQQGEVNKVVNNNHLLYPPGYAEDWRAHHRVPYGKSVWRQ